MGEVFAGRYELVDPIGRGGVGAVWRSWDRRRRRYVAAKVLQQSDAHALLRFVREQATRIDHPHVLAPASWAADDDKVLFTMDLVRGGSLAHLVGDYGPLPPRYVVVLLDQLLAGLTAVHAEGVVHRDIKPANILLEATGTGTPHVRLSDFGIAMRKGDARLTETNYVVGTPGYFAPEQLMGAEPDFTADLYAAGLVALYLLGGQKPDAEAIQARFLAVGMPPAPLGVPEPLWQVVGALLQPDPHARFRTATGARKALAAAIELIPEPGPGEEPVEIFDQIGPLPDGFGPEGPPATVGVRAPAPAAVPVPTPASAPMPASAPTPVWASGGAVPRTPLPAVEPHPQPPSESAASEASVAPQSLEPLNEPGESPGDFPLPPPRSTPPPTPPSPPSTPPRPTPPPSPPLSPRPQGRHAAPLPAHEPVTHTRTRAEQSAPLAQPLPEPRYADPRVQPEPLFAEPAQAQPQPPATPEQAWTSHPRRTPVPPPTGPTAVPPRTLPLPQPAATTPPPPHRHAPGDDTASAQLPARGPRPGPPAKFAVPILVLAALCFAVGIVALLAS